METGFPWGEVVRVLGTIAVILVQYLLSRPRPGPPSDKTGGGDKSPLKDAAARVAGGAGAVAILWT